MKHKLLLLYSWLVRSLLYFFPDIPLFMRFRGKLYGRCMKKCGRNFQVTHNAIIRCLENMEIGNDIYFANNVLILATNRLQIEDEVMLGPNVVVINGNHALKNFSYRYYSGPNTPIKIGFGSWVAANSVIASGAELPPSSLLAANSFLSKKYVEKGVVLGGTPAKIIRGGKNVK